MSSSTNFHEARHIEMTAISGDGYSAVEVAVQGDKHFSNRHVLTIFVRPDDLPGFERAVTAFTTAMAGFVAKTEQGQ